MSNKPGRQIPIGRDLVVTRVLLSMKKLEQCIVSLRLNSTITAAFPDRRFFKLTRVIHFAFYFFSAL